MKKYAGENESLVNENEPEITPKRANLSNPSGYKIPMPEEPSYEDTGRMSDLSTKVMTGEGMQKMEAAPEKMEAAPSKPKVVTKEELAKSGLTLREYMNQQQGLKPRGESAPAKTEPTKLEPVKPPVVKQKPVEAPKSNRVPTSEEAASNRQAIYDKVKSMGRSVSDYVSNFETPAERRSKERKEKMAKGYARGGSVTASSRGDGIAQRGKTRGKMC
jgi:hypothetical protein